MAAVTETTPGTAVTANAKADVQAVPTGQDDNWAAAADFNKLNQFAVAMSRSSRLQAAITLLTGAAEAVSGAAVRLTGEYANGLPRVTKVLTTDLNKVFAAAVEKIEQGGDLDGCAASTPGFGVYAGIVSGVFTTGTLYGLGASGALVTYTGGALPPVAIGLNTQYAYVDLGGRIQLDNSTLNFSTAGKAQVPTTADLVIDTLGVGATPAAGYTVDVRKTVGGELVGRIQNDSTSAAADAFWLIANGVAQLRMYAFNQSYSDADLASAAFCGGGTTTKKLLLAALKAAGTVDIHAGGYTTGTMIARALPSAFLLKKNVQFSTVTAAGANAATVTANLPDGLTAGAVSFCWLRTYDATRAKTTYQLTCLVK